MCVYIYIYRERERCIYVIPCASCMSTGHMIVCQLHPAAARCDMMLHRAFCAICVYTHYPPHKINIYTYICIIMRRVRTTGIGRKVRHGVASGLSCETSSSCYACSVFAVLLCVTRPICALRFWISEGFTQAESESYGVDFSCR